MAAAITLALAALLPRPGHAQPPPGSYVGTTSQGETFTIAVEDGHIRSFSSRYTCPNVTVEFTLNVGTRCPIDADGTFACWTADCQVLIQSQRIVGRFAADAVTGTLVVRHTPLFLDLCCERELPFEATLVGEVPAITITDVEVVEGDSGSRNADFLVTLSEPHDQPVSVNYSTLGVSAIAGSDFLSAGGTLDFAPGQTHQSLSVEILGDTLQEPDETYSVNLRDPLNARLDDLFGLGTILDDDGGSPCVADATTLCLNDGRFRVTTQWRTHDDSGAGQGNELTQDTGSFWFFHPDNVEMVIKTLDACTVANRFWVFAGGLTNVEVTLTVEDTETGLTRTYTNPIDTPFQPIQDTNAFATCPDTAPAASPQRFTLRLHGDEGVVAEMVYELRASQ